MAMPPFESCRQRIKRAKAHREAIAKMWNDMAKEDLYNVGLGMDDDGTGAIWITPTYGKALPDIFALQIGEMLYQLRAALNACIYEAAILETGKNPPPHENTLEFPICRSSSEYQKKATIMLGPLAKNRRAIVESVQPYNVPRIAHELMVFNFNRTLGILNDWARKDRHRKLHVVGSWASNANPKVRCPPGTSLAYMQVHHPGLLEKRTEIARFRLNGFKTDMRVQANPDLFIDIAVDEIPQPCADNDTLGNRLLAMLKTTHVVVSSIKDSF